MAKELSSIAANQISRKTVHIKFIFKINGVDRSSYLKTWSVSFDKKYGSASARFDLINPDGMFGDGNATTINIGDVVELIEYYDGDSGTDSEYKKFYGVVDQRSISKKSDNRTIILQCLDYISVLKHWNLILEVEGDKEEARNEEMEAIYLPEPNDMMAQLFNFANNAVADNPMPLIRFQDRNHVDFTDDQFDGFEIYYDVGQMKLGAPLNVRDNYKVIATYFYYTRGLFVEDVIRDILTEPDEYGYYLFGESSAQAVIDNHLTESFYNVEGIKDDTLVPNTVDYDATIEHQLTRDFEPTITYATTLSADYLPNEEDYDENVMYLTDITNFELESGETGTAKIGSYTITYTDTFTEEPESGDESGTATLYGISGLTFDPMVKNFKSGLTITRYMEVYNTEIYVDDVTGFPSTASTVWGTVGLSIPNDPDFIFSADLEGDGTLGQVFVYKNSNGIWYLKSGVLSQLTSQTITAVAVGDADDDGNDEIVAGYGTSTYIYNSGTGWTEVPNKPVAPTSLAIANNFDGAGNSAIVWGGAHTNLGCTYTLNMGTNWTRVTYSTPAMADGSGDALRACDPDNLGYDIVIEGIQGWGICYFKYGGTATRFGITDALELSHANGALSGDGKEDLIATYESIGTHRWINISGAGQAATKLSDGKFLNTFIADMGEGRKIYGYKESDGKLYRFVSGTTWTEVSDEVTATLISPPFVDGADEKILVSTGDDFYSLANEDEYTAINRLSDNCISDANLIGEDDDFCKGDIIEITTGDNVGDKKTITAFDGGTGTIFIDGTWTVNPAEGDGFVIYDSSLPSANIEIEINGDVTTYNSITEMSGETGYILGGIPSSGAYALKAKKAGSYVQRKEVFAPYTLWALTYNNLKSDLTGDDFYVPSGDTAEVRYIDKRYGRVILTQPLDGAPSTVLRCTSDYDFYTLQATGIEINRKVFREREIDNRFEAINFLRKYLAPNYIIRTIGDDKIWADYLTQKTNADYELTLATDLDYLEDEDLFTRVKLWTKNSNPDNIMFGEDVDYDIDDEEAYTGIAVKEELMYIGNEKSGILSEDAQAYLTEAEQFQGNDPTVDVINYLKDKYITKEYPSEPGTDMRVYATPISNEYGKIILDEIEPVVWINGIPVDGKVHRIDSVPVQIRTRITTITEGGGKSKSTTTYTLYHYTVFFPHTSIHPEEQIHLYDLQGVLQYTIEPHDPYMNYGTGEWTLPGQSENAVAETISTAGYHVLYDTSYVEIDYEDVVFKVNRALIPDPEKAAVRATFEYWSIAIGGRDIRQVIDGRRDTQLQLSFFGSPVAGFHLATIDLGQEYDIQAVDLIGGFYKPDDYRKFDVDFTVQMQSSTDGTNFYPISEHTERIRISGGKSISLEEEELGVGLRARYLKFNLYDIQRINYGKGRYVVAMTNISVYNNVVLKGHSYVIPTTTLAQPVTASDTEVYLEDSFGFLDADSGEENTAYLDKDISFTYTGVESGNILTGCVIPSGTSYAEGTTVTTEIASDTTIYDEDSLLPKLGDRVSKQNFISDRNLYTQAQTDSLSKAYLLEYYKDHSKAKVNVLYSPYLRVGQTIEVTDTYNNINGVNYFIESIDERAQGVTSITIGRYPAS